MINTNRYRLYREHKYLFYVFSKLLQLASTLDLRRKESVEYLKNEIKVLQSLLQSHAHYEETRIHTILKDHNSSLFEEAERQHRDQHKFFDAIEDKFYLLENNPKDADSLSYELYLDLRNFFAENLNHFNYEERFIMPELQRLLSDGEIRAIDKLSYESMSAEELRDMLDILFPHMNYEDKWVFLNDIKHHQPDKFISVWEGVNLLLAENERTEILRQLECVQ